LTCVSNSFIFSLFYLKNMIRPRIITACTILLLNTGALSEVQTEISPAAETEASGGEAGSFAAAHLLMNSFTPNSRRTGTLTRIRPEAGAGKAVFGRISHYYSTATTPACE
jgi:hypothetical protein